MIRLIFKKDCEKKRIFILQKAFSPQLKSSFGTYLLNFTSIMLPPHSVLGVRLKMQILNLVSIEFI